MKTTTSLGRFEGRRTWRGAESRNGRGGYRGRRYVGRVIRNLSMNEKGEKRKRWVCRICRFFLRLVQAKDEEEVEALV